MRSCAACMSTSTKPWAFSAKMYTPCSCAMALPKGQVSGAASCNEGAGVLAALNALGAKLCAVCSSAAKWVRGVGCHRAPTSDTRVPASGMAACCQWALGQAGAAGGTSDVPTIGSSWFSSAWAISMLARGTANAFSTAWRTAWCTSRPSRKRTSILVGCTFTSTRVGDDFVAHIATIHIGKLVVGA